MKNNFLYNVLMSDNVIKNIREHIDNLLDIVPEIEPMIGFEHNHPHHHLDVWEHTLYALKISPHDFDIRLALLLHDIGKPHSFQTDGNIRHFKGHPEVSAKLTVDILKRLDYSKDYIQYIVEIISRHDTPLTENDIINNPQISQKIFEVQKCDALAHNPAKNQKRLEYISHITEIFNKTNDFVSNI